MKTVEMIGALKEGQLACSNFAGVEVRKNVGIIVTSDNDGGNFIGKPLPLSGFVLNVEDWALSPVQISDMNKVLELIQTEDGVTLVFEGCIFYFDKDNKHTDLEFISFDSIIGGKLFEGCVEKSQLEAWGIMNAK